MILGYNTNVYYNGNTYHIQTEDNGLKNPVIISRIYLKGEIIAHKKASYVHIIEETDYYEKVKHLMDEQHRDMIRELLNGKYTEETKQQKEDTK